MEPNRIAVIGGGAIGGITAALMAEKGYDVTLVCKHGEIAQKAAGEGLHVTGHCGDRRVKLRAVCRTEELEGLYDLCLIATKAYDMPGAARAALPHLKEDSLVVSMQNGICVDELAAVVGRERTVGCVIGWGATMHAPGELEMTSGGDFIIGLPDGSRPARLESLREALSAVTQTQVSDGILAELWSKLIVNSCITSLGALCGLRLGEMMARRDARRIFLAVIGEAVQVAKALKIDVPPYGGKLNYFSLMKGNGALDRLRRHTVIRVVGLKYAKLKSSSLQSLERGRPTEIDCFNGYIARQGAGCGIPCPVNERLTAMVHEIERGERRISAENLGDPLFARLR
ncbi:MAG: 2-dehydropantoate 2-reductase [Clostridia bacterium]|nr:2-dehydropantoate 2-reductase [Clostridia bacterium]